MAWRGGWQGSRWRRNIPQPVLLAVLLTSCPGPGSVLPRAARASRVSIPRSSVSSITSVPVVPGRIRAEYLCSHHAFLPADISLERDGPGQLTGPPANADPMRAVGCLPRAQPRSHFGTRICAGGQPSPGPLGDLQWGRLVSCFSPGPPGLPPRPRTRTGQAGRR